MPTLAAWLMTMAGPLLIKALLAVGIGTLTFTGVTVALNELIGMATTNWASVPVAVLGLASVAAIPQCLGIIAGAFSARVGMWMAASAVKWVTK